MLHRRFALSFAVLSLTLLPVAALAHQEEVFKIGDKTYSIEIGSLNEPLTVDDKAGVELGVSLVTGEIEEDDHEHEGADPNAIVGLEKTLKVELVAGEKKKTLELTPVSGEPGSYKAVFIPTVQTTLTYRVFGTINAIPVDLSFACNPAGHPQVDEDKQETSMGDKVTRILKKGAFGCPQAKEDFGFPEPAPTLNELKAANAGMDWGVVGAVLGALGLIVGLGAWMKIAKGA